MPGIVLSIVAAVVDLTCATLGYNDVRVVTKPLVAFILAVTAWRGGARYLGAGLLFAAVGDELLLRDDPTRFMAGMGAFLIMQICFIAAFACATQWRPGRKRDFMEAAFLLAPPLSLLFLRPSSKIMSAALLLYGWALVLMARGAIAVGPIAAVGGLMFVVSDTTLAFGKFYPNFPLPPHLTEVFVDGSYFIAIVLIVAGLLNRKRAGNVLRRAV